MTRVWSAATKTMVVRCDDNASQCDDAARTWHFAGNALNERGCREVIRTHKSKSADVELFVTSMGWGVRNGNDLDGVAIVRDLCAEHAVRPIETLDPRSARARGTDLDPRDPTRRMLVPLGSLHWKDPDFREYDDYPRFLTTVYGTPKANLDNLAALAIDPDHPPRLQTTIPGFEAKTTTGSI